MTDLLTASGVTHAYRRQSVLSDVAISVAGGELVSIIGPNGSGKSTLLRCLGRVLRPASGAVALTGKDIWNLSPREFARRVAFVPQGPLAPPDLIVEELVWRGRYPHRGLFGRSAAVDQLAVARAIELADIVSLRHRTIGTLSGGERQRAFIAMSLAQAPELLLLDEPTTFLDIAHQHDLLDLLSRLNREQGLTVLMVMHDVGQAAMFSRRLIAIREGEIVADGPPRDVVTAEQLNSIFGAALRVMNDPETGVPLVLPALPATGEGGARQAPLSGAANPTPSPAFTIR